jgi:hypothetical protein
MATWLGAGEANDQQLLALGRMVTAHLNILVTIHVVVVLVLAVVV